MKRNLLIKIILTFIPTSKYKDYVDIGKDKRFILNLAMLDDVNQVLQKIELHSIILKHDAAVIIFNLK